jgi:hypothetical protein
MPNRPRWSALRRAANSLQSRAKAAAVPALRSTLTVEIEVTAVAMPFRSIASSDIAGVHLATRSKSIARAVIRFPSSASQRGGMMW